VLGRQSNAVKREASGRPVQRAAIGDGGAELSRQRDKAGDGGPAPVHKTMPPALQITGGAGIEAR